MGLENIDDIIKMRKVGLRINGSSRFSKWKFWNEIY